MSRAALSEHFLVAPSAVGGSPTLGSGRSVSVYEPGTTTPIHQTMYTSVNGSVVLAQPLSTDAGGTVKAWVDLPQRCTLQVGGVAAPYDAEFRVDPESLGISAGGTARFDGRQALNGTVFSGSPILTIPVGAEQTGFTLADVGKRVVVIEISAMTTLGQVETNRANGTIISVQSSTQVTMSVNASATISGAARVFWGSDDTAALQTLLDTMPTSASDPAGQEIRFPSGIAMISATLDWTNRHGTRLVGAGASTDYQMHAHGTVLVGCGAFTILQSSGDYNEIHGLALDGAGRLATCGLDVGNDTWHYSTVQQVVANGCKLGFDFGAEQYGTGFYDCTARHCDMSYRSLKFDTVPPKACQRATIVNCTSTEPTGIGMLLSGAQTVVIVGGAYGGTEGLRLTGNCQSVHLYGTDFEGNTVAGIRMVKDSPSSATPAIVNGSFNGLQFYGTGGNGANGIWSDGSGNVTFNSCNFFQYLASLGSGSPINFLDNGAGGYRNYGCVISADTRYLNSDRPIYAARIGLSDGFGYLTALSSGSNQPITRNTPTIVTPDTLYLDPNREYSAGTYTVGVQGNYEITAAVYYAADGTGTTRQLWVEVGGIQVEWDGRSPDAVNGNRLAVSARVAILAGQTIQVKTQHDAAGNLNLVSAHGGSKITVRRLP